MAAVFAVALMIAVPLFAAADTDADFTEDKAGYSIELKEPTDAQLTKLGYDKAELIGVTFWADESIFNYLVLNPVPTVSTESFSYTRGNGYEVTKDSEKEISSYSVDTEMSMVYDIVANGSLIDVSSPYLTKELKAAGEAIAAYVGDVEAGEKLAITGTVKQEFAYDNTVEFILLDDGKCIISRDATSYYMVSNIDLEIEVIKDNYVEKRFLYKSDVKGANGEEVKFEYDESPVKVGTTYTAKYDVSPAYSGDTYYEVNETKYSVVSEEKAKDDKKGTVTAEDIGNQSDIKIRDSFKTYVAGLPSSEEGMKIEKTYDAADSAFDSVVMDAVGNDLLKLLLIIGGVIIGVIVLIIVLIIVLVVLRKKKKKQ